MSVPRRPDLTPSDRAALVRSRDTGPRPDPRERAAARLKIADGHAAAEAARTGLPRPRAPDTVYRWPPPYRGAGSAGLTIRPGRGRKPAFPP